jgi:hypothetical protein
MLAKIKTGTIKSKPKAAKNNLHADSIHIRKRRKFPKNVARLFAWTRRHFKWSLRSRERRHNVTTENESIHIRHAEAVDTAKKPQPSTLVDVARRRNEEASEPFLEVSFLPPPPSPCGSKKHDPFPEVSVVITHDERATDMPSSSNNGPPSPFQPSKAPILTDHDFVPSLPSSDSDYDPCDFNHHAVKNDEEPQSSVERFPDFGIDLTPRFPSSSDSGNEETDGSNTLLEYPEVVVPPEKPMPKNMDVTIVIEKD